MAASKSTPPSPPPGKLAGAPVPAPPRPAPQIRAGMGDLAAPAVEVWTDEDHRRATGLLTILGPDGRAQAAAVPKLAPEAWREIYRGMLRARVLDERMVTLQRQGRIGFYAEGRGQEASVI